MPRIGTIVLGLALLAAVASVAACGRKGPLDAPPTTAATGQQPQQDEVPVSQRRSSPGDIQSILNSDTGGGP
jgi:predicted small lipoprotein YifL